MKFHRLFGSVLIFWVLFLNVGPCHAQQYSPQFQAFLNQIQQTYLAQKGENISVLRNQYPEVMAALVGHALRQQAVHVQQNPSLHNQFTSLQREAQVFITDVARTTSARMQDGSPYPPDGLWYIVNKVYQGQEEDWIMQNFRVRTGTMPSVLATRSGPQKPGPPVGDPLIKTEEKNQIELFGIGAPSVKGQPQATSPSQPPPRQITLSPDGIVGTWFTYKRRSQLKIWKQGDMYLGSMSGEPDWRCNFVHNQVSLRLKHAGAGKLGPVYKGQYYAVTGAGANINKWEDITFYYYLRAGRETFSDSDSMIGIKDFAK